ncbi:hypothetical protein LBMAG46_17240 [Planctomycetia bacterium]|nr:hypothetical protein LBMAG46_17240 [Planctomycetia bacterium]
MQSAGERANGESFAEAGDAFEEHMAAGDQSDQGIVEDVCLTDDDPGDFGPQPVKVAAKILELLLKECCFVGHP